MTQMELDVKQFLEYQLDTHIAHGKQVFHKIRDHKIVIYRWQNGMGYEANYKCLPFHLTREEQEDYISRKFPLIDCTYEICFFKENTIEIAYPYEVKELSYKDEQQLEMMKEKCSREDLHVAQIMIYDMHPIGVFIEDELVGVCSVMKQGCFYDIAVLVHPNHRKKGIAASLVHHMCTWIESQSGICLYRIDDYNMASRKTAEKLGFKAQIEVSIYQLGQ